MEDHTHAFALNRLVPTDWSAEAHLQARCPPWLQQEAEFCKDGTPSHAPISAPFVGRNALVHKKVCGPCYGRQGANSDVLFKMPLCTTCPCQPIAGLLLMLQQPDTCNEKHWSLSSSSGLSFMDALQQARNKVERRQRSSPSRRRSPAPQQKLSRQL